MKSLLTIEKKGGYTWKNLDNKDGLWREVEGNKLVPLDAESYVNPITKKAYIKFKAVFISDLVKCSKTCSAKALLSFFLFLKNRCQSAFLEISNHSSFVDIQPFCDVSAAPRIIFTSLAKIRMILNFKNLKL